MPVRSLKWMEQISSASNRSSSLLPKRPFTPETKLEPKQMGQLFHVNQEETERKAKRNWLFSVEIAVVGTGSDPFDSLKIIEVSLEV